MPLRAVVHGNWVAQQCVNSDETNGIDPLPNIKKRGCNSSAWTKFESSPSTLPNKRKKSLMKRNTLSEICNHSFMVVILHCVLW